MLSAQFLLELILYVFSLSQEEFYKFKGYDSAKQEKNNEKYTWDKKINEGGVCPVTPSWNTAVARCVPTRKATTKREPVTTWYHLGYKFLFPKQ